MALNLQHKVSRLCSTAAKPPLRSARDDIVVVGAFKGVCGGAFKNASISTTLSSRAKHDIERSEIPAKSRDLVVANPQTGTRSFDSETGRASAPTYSTQDDRAGEMSDLDIFWAFVKAGRRLAEIHVNYEQQPEYPLTKKEKVGEKLDYRVEKMKLSKDKTMLTYNRFLTLSGIPKETYEYRLGNRSALEWVIDQYQISTDKRSGITNDPNRADDPTYILRLIGQVITVSLETVKVVDALRPLRIKEALEIN